MDGALNGLALCSGIGGLELGVRRAIGPGYRCVCHVERDAYAASVLVARMAEEALDPAPVWDDLTTFDGGAWRGVVDIVTAGFPCQPFSVAGKRRGIEDERWIWPDTARIIRDVGPSVVFLENVPGLVQHGMPHVLGSLAALGFDAEWDLFSAADVGAPHRRARWFCLAYANGARRNRRAVLYAEGQTWDETWMPVPGSGSDCLAHAYRGRKLQPCGRQSEERGRTGDGGEALADGRGDGLEGQIASGAAAWTTLRGRRDCPFPWPPGPAELDRWAAVPEDAQPAVRRVADGIPARMDRLRCLGNAVVPQQAELAFRTLAGRFR